MSKQVTLMTDAIPYQEFAKLIGKSTGAVRRMIDKGKLPVIDMTDPQSASCRAGEYWVYLPAWNNGLKLAYESRPKEIRDGWLMWLGLGEPR
ncbi:regulatory phage cox family protein [Escherichia coli]|nr:regulatory phage cox family protein [Escherichia coli]MBO1707055.1 regulatory phage cox family protein [Escherichia coli]MBO1711616.1 regulatory phage cox family protein [Escherichia coli]